MNCLKLSVTVKKIVVLHFQNGIVDVETTGLSTKWDNIIEMGAIRYLDGVEVGRFQSLVQPPDRFEVIYIDDFISFALFRKQGQVLRKE